VLGSFAPILEHEYNVLSEEQRKGSASGKVLSLLSGIFALEAKYKRRD
jgi:hypothetical protein